MSEAAAPARSVEQLQAPPLRDGLLLAVAIAGVSFSGPLMAATAAPALAIALWRNVMGAGVTLVAAAVRERGAIRRTARRTWAQSALAGVALAAHFGTWVPSVTMTSVASATALVATQAIFSALIAHFRGSRLPRKAWVGIITATACTALITGADLSGDSRALAGDLLAIAGGLAAAIYVTIGASARAATSNTVYTACCYSSCSLVLLVVCLFGGVSLGGYPTDAWVKLALVTLCAQLLGHSLINLVLRSVSPTLVGLTLLFEIPGAGLVAYFWLHQTLPDTALVGVVGLFVGLALVSRARGSQTSEAVELSVSD